MRHRQHFHMYMIAELVICLLSGKNGVANVEERDVVKGQEGSLWEIVFLTIRGCDKLEFALLVVAPPALMIAVRDNFGRFSRSKSSMGRRAKCLGTEPTVTRALPYLDQKDWKILEWSKLCSRRCGFLVKEVELAMIVVK